jgi:membrane-associated phospholipid phosphatase
VPRPGREEVAGASSLPPGSSPGTGNSVRPSERLTALALLALSAVAALSGPAGAGARLLALAGLLGVVVLLARTGAAAGPLGWARDFAPAAVVVVVFLLLQPLIEAVNPRRYDAWLTAADARWFAALAAAWRGALGRPAWLTDLVYAAYWSFYLLPVSVALAARVRRGGAGLEGVAFPVLLAFWLSYAGYFIWPASGPRLPAADEAAVLGGGAVADAIRGFLHAAEATTLDAFPSGHTGISLVTAVVGGRLFRRAAPWLAAWAAQVVFATVYISVHYVADVVGGLALAGLTLALAPRLSRWLAPGAGR